VGNSLVILDINACSVGEKLVCHRKKNITIKKKVEEERNLLLTNLTQINKELTPVVHKKHRMI
jgi:hypothetical protein